MRRGMWTQGVPPIRLNFGTLSAKAESYKQWRTSAINGLLGVDYDIGLFVSLVRRTKAPDLGKYQYRLTQC